MSSLPPSYPIWHDSPDPVYPVLTETIAVDVCVIGLGGSGLTCIHEPTRFGCARGRN
ncbi:hypothetical protein [Chloroflexus sp.]|uniref:hypothetical protein n=1 Tax=Chloroflexus sp. TaxID=1904827 RepID=UPI002601E7A8|nr:hypothetical protein [uncultured Chloroflexus sp.]